jgi:hypothetical protein
MSYSVELMGSFLLISAIAIVLNRPRAYQLYQSVTTTHHTTTRSQAANIPSVTDQLYINHIPTRDHRPSAYITEKRYWAHF